MKLYYPSLVKDKMPFCKIKLILGNVKHHNVKHNIIIVCINKFLSVVRFCF